MNKSKNKVNQASKEDKRVLEHYNYNIAKIERLRHDI